MSFIPMSSLPGKFEGEPEFVEYLYALSLDGTDEECGSVDAAGYACKLDGPFELDRFAEIMGREPTVAERKLLTEAVGAILVEDPLGFVHGKVFVDMDEYERSWAEILDEFDLDEFEE